MSLTVFMSHFGEEVGIAEADGVGLEEDFKSDNQEETCLLYESG